jgi:predicted O-methyltransferase YrrM
MRKMRTFKHWTPRYVRDRVSLFTFERKNPETPWLTPRAIELLNALLKTNDAGLEWGSGRSTAWLAKRLARLTSIEDSTEWYSIVERKLRAEGIVNVDYQLQSAAFDGFDSPYVQAAAGIADRSLGFVLVDGKMRGHCANFAIDKLIGGGLLVVDNAHWYLDRPTFAPDSRTGKGALDDQWREFERRTSEWRCIWTSSGVSDTAIWIKPS